jgi:hypothetical protein
MSNGHGFLMYDYLKKVQPEPLLKRYEVDITFKSLSVILQPEQKDE